MPIGMNLSLPLRLLQIDLLEVRDISQAMNDWWEVLDEEVKPEGAFIPDLISRAWAQSKGQK
jgi:hypothetical protein